ncbi:butyrophilin-like protein 10 isoform X5 [Dicentrarchus labrax]|uniref:butyrophilin-like protein 10 isoform X5 n=1 Tax=Dicentrarchus labrax TaxID=13489 RepID=UPI0021F627FC|nr:butyrophilin-like protein 10 isoform X5 [Dicentrarchus labrax]
MLYLKDGWPSKPRLGAICSLVFHQTAVFLFLTQCCGGQSQMLGPSQPIVAAVGDDIMLPCRLEPAVDVTDQTVEWTRPDLSPRFVHVWRDGVELEAKKHPSYVGRGSLSINKLKHGDISLRLYKVKLSDEGTYRCFIPTLNSESSVKLVVGAVSSLIISFLRTKTDEDTNGVVLQCESNSWYPEPEVVWLDGEGNLLSAGPTETVRGPDDLYTVSSRVTVEKRHSNIFTCRVQQKDINQTRETHIQLPADLFMVQSSSAVRITICLAVCFIAVVAVFFVVWKWGRNEIKTTNSSSELQLLMDGERHKEQRMTESEKMKYLEQTKAKLEEELQKNEGEMQHVHQEITALMDQKKVLNNQKEKLILLQQEDKTQIEEYKKKMKITPKTDKDKKNEEA